MDLTIPPPRLVEHGAPPEPTSDLLVPHAPGVWSVNHELRSFGIDLRGRMTILRLPDGRLVLYSPVPLDDGLGDAIDRLGQVGFIVAPNRFHHMYAGAAKERYPGARLIGTPELLVKRRDLPFDGALGDEAPPEWAGALEPTLVRGAAIFGEGVLYHRESRTLVVGDLYMNIHHARGFLSRLLFWLEGVDRRFACPRTWRLATRDKAAARASVERMLSFDFERVLLAHGENLETEAHAPATAAMRWLVG